MPGKLTTHVLDTARGVPASGLHFRLFSEGGDGTVLAAGQTDADGRSAGPLLEGSAMRPGRYRLEFDVGDYFQQSGQAPTEPFLDIVVLAFRISEGTRHTHVPLLVSPFGYTTYRGS